MSPAVVGSCLASKFDEIDEKIPLQDKTEFQEVEVDMQLAGIQDEESDEDYDLPPEVDVKPKVQHSILCVLCVLCVCVVCILCVLSVLCALYVLFIVYTESGVLQHHLKLSSSIYHSHLMPAG